jgi:hypothetical protein
VFENRVLRRIFGPKRDEVTGGWKNCITRRIIKSRRMRWVGHVARMERRRTRRGNWWESQKKETTRKTKREVGG